MTLTPRQLIISFHDLHPGTRDCCEAFIKKSQELGAKHLSLLVVPRFHGQASFTEDSGFVEWLQSLADQGHDLCLHGYFHKADRVVGGPYQQLKGNVYTTGEGEFYQLNKSQAREKLMAGLREFKAAKLPVYGFTAPAWLASPEAKTAIRESGFLYNTLWDGIELPASNLFIKAPTLVYSSRNSWRRAVSKLWISLFHSWIRHFHILRLAVHPIDFDYPGIETHLYKVLEKALRTRTTSTYRDLVPDESRKPVSLANV